MGTPQADLANLTYLQGYSDRQFSLTQAQSITLDNTALGERSWPTVLTFFPHPQEFFSGVPRQLLTPLDEKALYLKAMGVKQLVLLPFNQSLARLTPQQFIDTILRQHLQAQHVSVGSDFRFGCRRSGSVADLQSWGEAEGVEITVVPLKQLDAERISSSRIRQALETADLATATHLLGRPYALTGRIVQGQQLGRTIGFPTANLKLPPDKFLPCNGVYGVKVYGASFGPSTWLPGVMNIGHRPTVSGIAKTIEVHLLGWSGNLYGQTLSVTLEHYLRPEQKFDSLDRLKAQIQSDCEAATAALAVGNSA